MEGVSMDDISVVGKKDKIKKENVVNDHYKRVLRYKRYSCLDLCNGKLAYKYKMCEFWETLCYFPLWCLSILLILFLCSIAVLIFLTYYYTNITVTLKSYTQTCNSVSQCDGTKGLFCKTNSSRGVYEESCNCPALGVVNTCDCPSSHYWDGSTCASVYSYGEVY
jgi:hypothetical protein